MKKITLMIIVSLMSYFGYAQGLPEENFDTDPWVISTVSPDDPAPPGWTVYNEHGPIYTWIQTIPGNPQQIPYLGVGHSAFLQREQTSPIDAIPSDWLITKPFTMPELGELHFMSRLTLPSDGGAVFKIMIGKVHDDGSMPTYDEYEQIQHWTEFEINPNQTEWTAKKVVIPQTYTGEVRIAFIMQGRDADRWFIDNVRVSQACTRPTAGAVSNVTSNTADFTWTNPGGVAWEIEVVEAGLNPVGTGVTYNGTLPYTAPGLIECTEYKFYVRQRCTDGGISDWVGPVFFKTRCVGDTCASPIVIPSALPYSTTSDTALHSDFYDGTPGTGCNATGNYLAGNDVVYSYTPNVTGNIYVSLGNTSGAAGVFIYNNCADIGTGCLAGKTTSSATTPAVMPSVPVVAGTTYYIVVSTNGTPQSTPYTLTIQQASCPMPTNGTSSGVTGTSANLSWTAGTVGASSWQLAVQPVGSGIPAGAGTATTDNSDFPVTQTVTGAALEPGTSYEYYVRETCGGGTFSVWSGPFLFTTIQVPSTLDYAQNFDGATHGWTLGNGTEINKWMVGTATSNSPGKSLYITDNGTNNQYNIDASSVVHAYRDIEMPPVTDQLSLQFDWKGFGESTWDYIQVWLVPADFTPTPGDEIQPEDGIKIGAERYNLSMSWNTALAIIDASDLGGTNQRLVFQWTNDGSAGSQPPAAIDNIDFKVITCPQPSDLALGDLNNIEADINWTAPGIAPDSYDIYHSQSSTPPTADSPVSQNVPSNTATLDGLVPSATNFVWVRSHCSDSDKSFWTGPLVFNTPQIAADLNYEQNFDLGAHNFTLSNGTQANGWFVGTATFNSPTSSLYISNNNGVTNGFNGNVASVVHAYRDVNLPVGTDQLLLRYDWKSAGDTWANYLTVWFVPISYSPTPGTTISGGGGRILLADMLAESTTWKTNQVVINAGDIGATGRLIFEWRNSQWGGAAPPAAIDNIELSIITCPAPSEPELTAITNGEASFEWTAPASAVPGYDYYLATTTGEPAADVEVSGTSATTTVTVEDLPNDTHYYFWVRSHCSDADGNSFWVGPVSFNTPQVPADMDYTQNFDGAGLSGFTFVDGGQTNKWAVGSATSKSPANSLYVSNDNGATYTYTNSEARSIVHAYRDVKVPAGSINEVLLQFDWKNVGEWGDYFQIWIVPVTYTPQPGQMIEEADDRLQIGENFMDNPDWKNSINVINGAGWADTVKRIVFQWQNDEWQNGNVAPPPGAIDNIKFSVITCSAPSVIAMPTLNAEDVVFTWTPPAVVPAGYDYYLTTSEEMPTETTEVSGYVTVPTVTISGLPPNVNHNFWVRSNCGDEDGTSFWIGPFNFNTPQIPAVMPYIQNFDATGTGDSDFTLVSREQTNKWTIGAATFNSPANALYISNTNGATNTYNASQQSISHAYRDVAISAGAANIDFAFDWKNRGDEYGSDYITVWAVPTSYTPVAGQEITSSATRIDLSGELLENDKWVTANYVFDASAYVGAGAVRFVFEWENNGWDGTSFAGAIDNVDFKVLTCPKPTDLGAEEIGMTSAMLGWTENGTAEAWEVYVVEQGQPFPSASTEGHAADSNPYKYELLEPGVKYEYYVRADCGNGDKSRWAGPYRFNSNVCELEDQCPYEFILTDSGEDGWNNNEMHVIQSGIVVAVLGPQIQDDEGAGPVTVSVPLCSGIPFEVFWVNGVNTEEWSYGYDELGLKIVNPYNGQTVFDRLAGTPATNMGTTIFTGMSYCEPITCLPPSNLVSVSVANVPNTTQLSWIPSGDETQWEVLIQAQGGKFPSNTPAPGTTHLVNDTPKHTETLVPGMLYEYYVRAICGPDDESFWTGPLYFSIFTPPACADVKVFDPALEIVAPDTEYVLCEGDEVAIKFSANYFESAETTSYAVESIPYNLPFPTTGGTKMDITEDDQWAPVADLPFEFCFFGEVYNKAQVGSNGVISFNANYVTGDNCRYYFDGATIPDTSFEIKNAIYGVYQDIDVTAASSLANPEINYQVIGNYPCRAFVVNFSEIAQFGSECHEDETVGAQTSQVVIYEITNIIEVYVKNRVACTSWRDGEGVIGVQNAAGTVGFTPPGRNTGPWSAQNEAWRFVPNGAASSTFEWFKNGDLFSTEKDIEVVADETAVTNMTARATYNLCNGEVIIRESNFVLRVQEEIITADLKDLSACAVGGPVTFDLNDALVDIVNPTDYVFSFYATEAAAEAGEDTDDLPTSYETDAASTVIWVRIAKTGSPCYIVKSFDITLSNTPVIDDPADVTACGSYTLPALTGGNYFGQPNGVEPLSALEDITVTRTIYVYAASGTTPNCVAENSFVVTIVPTPELEAIANVSACDAYVLPALAEGDYFTEAGGAGTKLAAGDQITTVGTTTLYVYAETGTTPNCTDEVSFTVTIALKPVVPELDDVVQCVSYKLPALTSGKYYSGANGVGEIAVGTELTSTQTVYVYAENGTDPNKCTAESSFNVTIIPTAIIATTQGCENNDYTLEVLFDGDPTYSADNTTIEWTDSKGALVGSTAKLIVTEPGIYTVTVTPNGGIECPVSDDVIVDATTCMIPRGISPNGDGKNDRFDLTSLRVKHLSVFNRYGKEVYKKDNYTNQFFGQGTHGDDLPTGTYFYMIEREGGESITGWVYINREE